MMNGSISLYNQNTNGGAGSASNAVEYKFSPETVARMREFSRNLNSDLAIKEAGSWESARKFVLTD